MGIDRYLRPHTGAYAEDLAESADIGKTRSPGKQILQQGEYQFGDDSLDKGAACEADPSKPGCFLSLRKRDRVLGEITRLTLTAQTNYKAALLDLKIGELLKKEEDLSWVLVLALDLVTAHLATVVATAIKTVQASAMNKLVELDLVEMSAGNYAGDAWRARAEKAIALATPTRIEAGVKAGFAASNVGAKKAGKAGANVATSAKKATTLAYIDQLRDSCDVAFDQFIRSFSSHFSDAELVVLREGMLPEYQSTGAYIASLGAKLDRFRKSGTLDIGRKDVGADNYGGHKIQDTRVIYVQDINGTQTPWYQKQDGDSGIDHGNISPGDPMFEQTNPTNPKHQAAWGKFGGSHGRHESAVLDRIVPEEFRDIAIAASESRWGSIPVIDDGYVALLKKNGMDVDVMRQRLRGGMMVTPSKTFPPDRTPWDTKPMPAGMPPGSIFEEKKP